MTWLLISVAVVAGGIGLLLGMVVGAAAMIFTSHRVAERREHPRRADTEPDWGYTHG